MDGKLFAEGKDSIEIATLGLKKSLISLALNRKGIKKSGKGSKGNAFFNRQDYVSSLLELLGEYKCYTVFNLDENNIARFEFCDGETGAKIVTTIPWKPVNVCFVNKQTGEVKKVLDDMQEIGAAGSYALRYLEVWFFSLAEEDVVDMAPPPPPPPPPPKHEPGFIYNPLGHKLPNPQCKATDENKIRLMFAAAKSTVVEYEPESLIKSCIAKLHKGGFVSSDSKKEFPINAMGALLKVIGEQKAKLEKAYLEKKVKEKFNEEEKPDSSSGTTE